MIMASSESCSCCYRRCSWTCCWRWSITLSLVVFLFALHIERPLEFSAFPSPGLLLTTLFRLALNVATTRLILLKGHEGKDAAGHVLEAFAQFVVGGNLVVGVVIFLILVVINFVVITKGAGRIAEVAARFTLDAMPGKQMAIDADLGAGLIKEDEAKRRRKAVEQEADFFGSMDGASKFVRGDAVAGIMITAVNLFGGLVIGVVQKNMPIGSAAAAYSQLTIGDGLVTQLPALLTSIAAGLVDDARCRGWHARRDHEEAAVWLAQIADARRSGLGFARGRTWDAALRVRCYRGRFVQSRRAVLGWRARSLSK